MSEVTVYLAGPVAAYDDGGAGWRDRVKVEYPEMAFRDPLNKYNVPVDDLTVTPAPTAAEDEVGVAELVEGDKELLRESDGVLVGYSAVRSIGTPMEVMWARERDYQVALWVRDGTDFADLSPWYRYHATTCTTRLEKALRHLKEGARGEA